MLCHSLEMFQYITLVTSGLVLVVVCYICTATVTQLNRQLAEDIQLLDREIERNSPKQLPTRHRYAAAVAGAPGYRRR